MLLDIFNEGNSVTVNYKAIQLFGLQTATYLTELLTIYGKATKKGKLVDDNYFKVNRSFISDLLSLSSEEQLVCDANLAKTGLLKKHSDDPDVVKLDLQMYLSLIANDDVKLIENVKKEMSIKRPKGVKQSQRQQWINTLKDSVQCSNYELLTALRDWVDGVLARPNGFLSKSAIKIFQDTLNNYTKGDLDLALRIVQIATVQGYKNCEWAISIFEDSEKRKKKNQAGVRVTQQEVATQEDLSNKIF